MGTQEVKLSLFADDVILYIENPKDSTPKLLKLIQKFSNAGAPRISGLSICLWPRARSWSPGIEYRIGLLAWSLLVPLPVSLPLSLSLSLCVSLMNK